HQLRGLRESRVRDRAGESAAGDAPVVCVYARRGCWNDCLTADLTAAVPNQVRSCPVEDVSCSAITAFWSAVHGITEAVAQRFVRPRVCLRRAPRFPSDAPTARLYLPRGDHAGTWHRRHGRPLQRRQRIARSLTSVFCGGSRHCLLDGLRFARLRVRLRARTSVRLPAG